MKPVTWGTAGHIDHGKTALIEALTGTNTDRLKEEQQRGVTIDIGFAFLSGSIAFIDVPGHEKFVKNMVTGVSTIDAGLLVIAADDGVMPQTREHLDILSLLGVAAGCVALTKIDLVDPDWVDLVEETIRETLEGTFLEDAPIIRCSARERTGIDALRGEIEKLSETIPVRADRGIARLPVDRAFTVKGFGTVVTGTVISGEFKPGQPVELLPSGTSVKVRGIQTHGHPVESVGVSERAALNLSNIAVDEIGRGDQVTEAGMLSVVNQVYASVKMLPGGKDPLKRNQRVRIHLGTTEILARCSMPDRKEIPPGESGFIVLHFEEPAIVGFADRCIMRFYSPMHTIGGGRILYPGKLTHLSKEKITELLRQLESDDPIKLIPTISRIRAPELLSLHDLSMELFIAENLLKEPVQTLLENGTLLAIESENGVKYIVTDKWENLRNQMIETVQEFHSKNPKEPGIPKNQMMQQIRLPEETFDLLLEQLTHEKSLSEESQLVKVPEFEIRLSDEEQAEQSKIEDIIRNAEFEPPSLNDLESRVDIPRPALQQHLKILLYENKIVRIGGALHLHSEMESELHRLLADYFEASVELSVGDFKSLVGSSRKYVIPLLEYADQQGWTIRDGEVRIKHNL